VVGEGYPVAVLDVAQQAVRPGQHGVLRDQVSIHFPDKYLLTSPAHTPLSSTYRNGYCIDLRATAP
jgi:hypothetical protein